MRYFKCNSVLGMRKSNVKFVEISLLFGDRVRKLNKLRIDYTVVILFADCLETSD